MARSRLLDSLIRIANDYRAADAHGVSPETIRQWRDERADRDLRQGFDRRSFIKGAATIAAAASVPNAVYAALPSRSVAIVGGGIAGLSCALTLIDRGVTDVAVYEANTRLGGRMHTNVGYFENGQTSEWCGELIDTNHTTVQTLAKRFNLPLVDLKVNQPAGSEDTYHFFGQYYPRAQAVDDFAPVWDALQKAVHDAPYPTLFNRSTPEGRILDNTSVYEWIERNVPGGHASPMGSMLDVAYTEELAVDTALQSSLNLIYLLGFQKKHNDFEFFGLSDERYHIEGGNQRLPLAIAGALGGANGPVIKTGTALRALRLEADGRYTLTLARGRTTLSRTVDYVVLALPFAILRDLDYSRAGFDALKDFTIQNLGMGRSGKLQLQFRSRLWNGTGAWPGISNGNTYSDLGYQNTWDVTRGQAGATGIQVQYSGGPVTLALSASGPYLLADGRGVAQDVNRFLTQLDVVFPGIAQQYNGKAASSVPHLDPFLKLSYSHYKLGQYQQIAGYEAVRQANCFFAGEHTSVDFQGFMEGGAISGVQAAKDVIAEILGPAQP